ncbi:hypothetical protein BKA70DRAFT_1293462 [Coprinopsis sp. MPI-PUGE-AT-0042]|nr:hypothetical protein BKA70DRAFT_1293462 [Coprinopsis sp. MPI-PUGE-AT-0042]
MVAIRRARASKKSGIDERLDNDDIDSQTASEEDDEYEELDDRSKKRKRSNGKGKGKGKRRRRLAQMEDLPAEIRCNIFKYLSPKDLLNIARTGKMWKRRLMHPSWNTVWRDIRQMSYAPAPPKGFSEIQWASLLFDPNCQRCGTSNIHYVDWNIRKRLCTSCKMDTENGLVGTRDQHFLRVLGMFNPEVYNYLPYTNAPRWSQQPRSQGAATRKLYWVPEVRRVSQELEDLKKGATTPEGREALQKWKEARLEYVASCNETKKAYQTWVRACEMQKYAENDSRERRRVERVIDCFLALDLGYAREDVERALYESNGQKHRKGTDKVTPRVFNILRPKLEPDVKAAKARREREAMESATVFQEGFMTPSALFSTLWQLPQIIWNSVTT